VCAFIGAQAPVDTKKTGGKNPLVEMAHAIDILGGDEPDPIRGEQVAGAPSSYEGFMSMFGGGSPLPPGAA
jgi:hypothetical protein